MNDLPELTYDDFKAYARHCLAKRVSVIAFGHPGIGKSTLAAELAEEMKLPLIDIRLAQRDPAEIGGIYIPNHETKTLDVFVPNWVRRAADAPVFLFLDELNAGISKLHMSVAYSILLDRKIGEVHFHPDTVIMGAGNLLEDSAIVTPLSDALIDRVWKAILKPNAEIWLTWALKKNLSPDIMAYIDWRRESVLYQKGESALATPRSWTRAATLDTNIPNTKDGQVMRKRMIAGCVGEAHANEFWAFVKTYQKVNVEGILTEGKIPVFPKDDPSMPYAVAYALAYRLTDGKKLKNQNEAFQNLAKLFEDGTGFTGEFQTMLLRQIVTKKTKLLDELLHHPALKDTCTRITKLLLAPVE